MSRSQGSNRRSFMKYLAASPLLAQIAAQDLYAKSAAAIGLPTQENVYTRLGVKTVINCRGTWTYLSGSLQFPEVRAAQTEASHHFVNMVELQNAAGRKLAELTGAESGMITSGAAGSMAASAAACMAGTDPAKIWQLPDTAGMKHEVIMAGGRSAFDSAIRLTGANLVLVESPEEIANAINDKTAMIYTTDLGDKLAKQLAIAKAHNIPMLLDDAAGIPPARAQSCGAHEAEIGSRARSAGSRKVTLVQQMFHVYCFLRKATDGYCRRADYAPTTPLEVSMKHTRRFSSAAETLLKISSAISNGHRMTTNLASRLLLHYPYPELRTGLYWIPLATLAAVSFAARLPRALAVAPGLVFVGFLIQYGNALDTRYGSGGSG